MKTLLWLCALRLMLGSIAAMADNTYQIELVVFARDSAEAEAEERWHGDYNLHYPERLVVLQGSDGAPAPFQLLPAASQQLRREASAIAQRRNMRVLFHGAWQQPVGELSRATSVFIGGGQSHGEHQELEGFVTLSVERYLHINTQLWLSRFGGADAADVPVLPQSPVARIASGQGPTPSRVYVLRDNRRMRSSELHYQDHPRLGTLVLVTPLAVPATTPSTPAAPAQ